MAVGETVIETVRVSAQHNKFVLCLLSVGVADGTQYAIGVRPNGSKGDINRLHVPVGDILKCYRAMLLAAAYFRKAARQTPSEITSTVHACLQAVDVNRLSRVHDLTSAAQPKFVKLRDTIGKSAYLRRRDCDVEDMPSEVRRRARQRS